MGNLATGTVDVGGRWGPWVVWGVAAGLMAAVAAVEWARQRPVPGEGEGGLDAAVRTLSEAVRLQWTEEAARQMVLQPLPLRVRWSSTVRAVAASRTVVLDDQEGADWDRLPLRGDVREIVSAFQALPNRQLVILGEAGAGKSVLAMLLTLGLLDGSRPAEPVPVLLPIASWDPIAEDFKAYLIRRLREEYRFLDRPGPGRDGLSLAEALLAGGRILAVLDGLDEIAPQGRVPALQSLDRFAAGRPVVVTCRSREYESVVARSGVVLSRAAVVEIEPVDTHAVIDFLAHPAPSRGRWEPVFEHLLAHPGGPLAEALSTPLMVSLARANYREPATDPAELLGPSDRDGVARMLLDGFVPTVYDSAQRGGSATARPYTPGQVVRWLECVAFHLDRTGNRDLWWWQLGRHSHALPLPEVTKVFTAMVTCWAAAVLAGLAASVFIGPARGAGVALVVVTALGAGALGVLRPLWPGGHPAYVPTRYRSPRWRRFQRVRLAVLAGTLSGTLAGAVLHAPLPGLAAGLCTGLAMAVPALNEGLANRLSFIPRSRRSTPRGTIYATLDNALVAGVGTGVLGAAAFAVMATLVKGVDAMAAAATAFAVYGLMAAFSAGLWAWTFFRVTHFRLALRGWLPWRLWPFLSDALDRGILRQAGTAWQFRHALLQDHLARSVVPRQLRARAEAGSAYARYQLVDVLLREDRPEELFALLRSRVDDPEEEDLWARHHLVELLPLYGRVDEAVELLEARVRADPFATKQLVDLLVEHRRVEDLTRRAESGDPYAAERLVDLLVDQGQEAVLRDRARAGDGHAGARLADLLTGQGRRPEAAVLLREHVPAWWAERRLADMLAADGKPDEAIAMLRASANPKARQHLVDVLGACGRVDEAIATALSVAEAGELAWARRRLIDLLVQDGRTDEAITMLRNRAAAGDHRWAAGRLVDLLALQGRIEELRPLAAKDRRAAQHLVDLLVQRERVDEAIAFCGARADGGPPEVAVWARKRLTELLARQGRAAELRARADAGDAHATAWLVGHLVELGRTDQAVTILRARADAGDPWAAYEISQLLDR
ncbi:hypothetical protein [Spirillospora sp. NPDC029432]|uniref:hypothetical protein n=1 Tax=Spirillospora sp. NPDC029432 TaxID=3154599 RepID=UPI0034556002